MTFSTPAGPVQALANASLTIAPREFVSLLGPSGCGKSTLLRLVADILAPTEGRIEVGGEPPVVARRRRAFGFVFQDSTLLPWRNALQNVLLPLEIGGDARRGRPDALALLELVGLRGFEEAYPWQLSGGMRQRVAIAQALAAGPKILLMDEPFGALDASTRQDMQLFLLEQWQAARMTVLFVTHDLDEAVFLGSRVLVLSQYYCTDEANCEGAKIVKDCTVPGGHPKPTNFRFSPEYAELIAEIQREGLEPDHRQHIKDFDLTHRDAFRTISAAEWKR
jgi:NitT/TauT family transport system ATP-binding protein